MCVYLTITERSEKMGVLVSFHTTKMSLRGRWMKWKRTLESQMELSELY